MFSRKTYPVWLTIALVCLAAVGASAQSFKVQCPASTITHPNAADNNSEPAYVGATYTGRNGYGSTPQHINGAIKCQQISGGDGFATMGDGSQTYMFSFGPLSGLADMAAGKPGTQFPNVFNTEYAGTLLPGDPATTMDQSAPFTFNGAVGLLPDISHIGTIYDISIGYNCSRAHSNGGHRMRWESRSATWCESRRRGWIRRHLCGHCHQRQESESAVAACDSCHFRLPIPNPGEFSNWPRRAAGTAERDRRDSAKPDGHVDPRPIMDVGVMNGNIPAPLMAIDEDDEFFLTLTNVGMIMRPDLFEQHTVHFHGYPNASSFYDGVPDASVAINIGGSFTYYYLAPDAGTYFWHCHITPPEHLQMGMVGPDLCASAAESRSGRHEPLCRASGSAGRSADQRAIALPTSCAAIRCRPPTRCATGSDNRARATGKYAYNDGDGSTCYDVEYPIQIHGFDPNFHFVGMTFNPEGFADMKDKYFLLNGRSYPDTVTPVPLETQSTDGVDPLLAALPSIINIPAGGKSAAAHFRPGCDRISRRWPRWEFR